MTREQVLKEGVCRTLKRMACEIEKNKKFGKKAKYFIDEHEQKEYQLNSEQHRVSISSSFSG